MSISLFIFLIPIVQGEIFTALTDLNHALNNKIQFERNLLDFALEEKSNLIHLKSFSENLISRSHDVLSDPESYVSDPLKAFSSIVKINDDWKNTFPRLLSKNEKHNDLINNIFKTSLHLPTADDVSGIADALIRLQSTYKIATSKIADGIFHDKRFPQPLTSSECFDIALRSFDKDYFYFVQWMTEAYNRMKVDTTKAEKIKILDYLSYGYFKQGNFRQALALTNQWLKIDPSDPRALSNKEYFEHQYSSNKNFNLTKGENKDIYFDEAANVKPLGHLRENEFQRYEALCRGENPVVSPKAHSLSCRYFIPHHYYSVAPIKEETMYHKPRIVMYHDVINDHEIEEIKKLSMSRLNRATVQNSVTGALEFASYRISKSAWLKTELASVTKKINKRISMLTGLNIETAEELQVVNYGIGGHYEPHFDFARKREINSFDEEVGNRLATLLFYMSNVDAGGATVFTDLGAKIWPKKGSAAFWWNLLPSGDGDLSTRHAACPVLIGSKWVMNKWFHERGQELIRPCNIKKHASSVLLKTILHD